MADTLQFELVAPERLIFSGDVEMVVVPEAVPRAISACCRAIRSCFPP